MKGRTRAAYMAVLLFIEENVVKLNPEMVMADYEQAPRRAMETMYPGVIIVGCSFHYCQAIRKNAAKVPGLLPAVWADEDVQRIFRQFLRLPLLPIAKIAQGFDILKEKAAPYPFLAEKFVPYVEQQWINKVRNLANLTSIKYR